MGWKLVFNHYDACYNYDKHYDFLLVLLYILSCYVLSTTYNQCIFRKRQEKLMTLK